MSELNHAERCERITLVLQRASLSGALVVDLPYTPPPNIKIPKLPKPTEDYCDDY